MAVRYEAGEVNVVPNAEAVAQLDVILHLISGVVAGTALQATNVLVVVDPISHVVDEVLNAKSQTPEPVVVGTGGVVDAVEVRLALVVGVGQARRTGPTSTSVVTSIPN